MSYQIDHVVIGVNDLAEATADFTRAGFTVTPGGEHSTGNTHNALITFDDGAYLELIAFKGGVIAPEHKWGARLAQAEGFLDYCLTGPALAPEVARLTAAGLPATPPQPLGRFRPDGQRLEWQSIIFADPALPLPFVIEDLTPRALRVPADSAATHAVLATGIESLRVLVPDLAAAAAAYTTLLQVTPAVTATPVRGVAAALRFDLGHHWLELLAPEPDRAPAASELRTYLAERGAVPYELTLRSQRTAGLLPTRFTHQARIRLG